MVTHHADVRSTTITQEDDAALVEQARRGHLTEARRERVRAKVTAGIPWWYSPWGHLGSTTGVGLAVLALSAFELMHSAHMRWTDALVVPGVFVFANFFEWLVHRDVLHRRRWPVEVIYDKHTPMHHMVYTENDMALRDSREFRFVLIPAAGVLGIVAVVAPVAFGVSLLWSSAAGWLFLVTGSLYMVFYEVLHLCYHAPAESFIGRLKFLHVLRAHHAKHHDPRLMQKWNFNVTIPLADWVLGTIAKESTKNV
jgi:hypothetical protein